jgi:hypothetical protein
MAWVKKPIDRMEMMHLLGLVYARTAPGFGKVALEKLIKDEAKPTVRAKARCVLLALTQSGLLLYCKEKKNREYRWNMKEWGPVSLLVADAMIAETEAQIRRKGRMCYASRKKHEDEG